MADERDESYINTLILHTDVCGFEATAFDLEIRHHSQTGSIGTPINASFYYEVSSYIAAYDRPHEKQH
jgi:hypothetical protein